MNAAMSSSSKMERGQKGLYFIEEQKKSVSLYLILFQLFHIQEIGLLIRRCG